MCPTKTTLDKERLRLRKSFGQHILNDKKALETVAQTCALTSEDDVLEIGAGTGNLSGLLAEKAKNFYALEKDRRFEPALRQTLKKYNNTKIIICDIMGFNLKNIFSGKKLIVAGNLPYYITTPILNLLLEQKAYIKAIIITVQKEVACRIIASAGSKDYGRLSCLLQFYTRPSLVCDFSKELFSPKPQVDSSLIRLDMLDEPSIKVKSEKMFFAVVKAVFSHRRKTLLNSLITCGNLGIKKETLREILGKVNIPASIRGEQLGLSEIGRLADAVYAATFTS